MCLRSLTISALIFVSLANRELRGNDLTGGVMAAIPLPAGTSLKIDGSLADWDLSAAEPIWIAPQTAARMHADVSLMYDAQFLYVGASISLPDRALYNPNNPTDAYWWGDLLELRLASDPALAYPLEPTDINVKSSNRIVHASFWKNTESGKDFINLAYGVAFDKGSAVNPPESAIVIRSNPNAYTIEAKIPWSALNVPGGKIPFVTGQKMTATIGLHWGGDNQTPALFRLNPGAFAFQHSERWGQVEFAANGKIAPRHGTIADALAAATSPLQGVPITFTLPRAAKVSVNILGPKGEVIREIIGGEPHPAGPLTVYWDGHDQWDASMPPGKYAWGAYASDGLSAGYIGTVGTSGEPAYETADGKGNWGGDHGDPTDVAADSSGLYFLWMLAESGRVVVKTDYDGHVLWRKTPFVGGGFGPHYAIASNGKYVFITFGKDQTQIFRLDATNGQLTPFGTEKMIAVSDPDSRSKASSDNVRAENASTDLPESAGLACDGELFYASLYSANVIRAFNAESGAKVRDIACLGPRGIAFDEHGNLFAVSDPSSGAKQVLEFSHAAGLANPIITTGLSNPYDVAVDHEGWIHISDLGPSQQVKTFSHEGRLIRTLGSMGGRTFTGRYDGESFLRPWGLAADAQGGLLVAEASIPKVMTRLDAATGKVLRHWFGATAYAGLNIPDPLDPLTAYVPISNGFLRATIPSTGGIGNPTAYWALPTAGYPAIGTLFEGNASPVCMMAANGRKYLFSDTSPHGICVVDGDRILPVGYARITDFQKEPPGIELWSDTNGDHQPQPEELTLLTSINGQPIARAASQTGSMWISNEGDLYLATFGNSIIRIPAKAFAENGAIYWDIAKATYAVPQVFASAGHTMFTGWREGILGMRADSKHNVYTCFNTTASYATPAKTEAMKNGLGHTAGPNVVKFAKYSASGELLWMSGRKATAAAKPGEMYHFWVLAGMVGDGDYIAGASEWGQIYFYTHDGFFVDAIMNNPGLAPPAGPYTFGSETFGSRVQDFTDRGEVWAYSSGRTFKINGFDHGAPQNEKRQYGTIALDRTYDASSPEIARDKSPVQIVPLPQGAADAMASSETWAKIPTRDIMRDRKPLANVQFTYDTKSFYARFHVADPSPLRNNADNPNLLFKGGDCVGIDLGPINGGNGQPILGDVRFLAAQVDGKPVLLAMKPITKLGAKPEIYTTPAAGERKFEFVGPVPGGQAVFATDADGQGYTVTIAIPLNFIETPVTSGEKIAIEAEVLLSGQAARGLQAASRNYLFTPDTDATSMTDDAATESWLYPQYWGIANVMPQK